MKIDMKINWRYNRSRRSGSQKETICLKVEEAFNCFNVFNV